jgi:hypothetical protein
MASTQVPLPKLGVDLLSRPASAAKGAVRSAVNVDISNAGVFSRRDGYTTVVPGGGYHSLHADDRGLFVGRGNGVYLVDEVTLSGTTVCDMLLEAPVDFSEYNGNLYICGPQAFYWIPADSADARAVGVALPNTLPSLSSTGTGQLADSTYSVALSWVDERGEESPTKLLGVLPLVGGVQLSGLELREGFRYRIYMSPPNGGELYLAAEFDATFTQYVVLERAEGAIRSTQYLAPMPPGNFVRGDKGRLYVAAGDTLWFSEPMRPHLTDPRHNFIKFSGDIRFMEIMNFGMYVGDDRGVWWLAGTDPTKFELQSVSDALAVKRSSLTILTSHLGERFSKGENNAALWLSAQGYMVGSVRGEVTPLHPERVRLAADLEGKSVFMTRKGVKQVITLTAAAPSLIPTFGVATDDLLQ